MAGPLKISVGVIAWNKGPSIEVSLESVLKQTVFRRSKELGFETELMVIASGCTDRTVEVAQAFLRRLEPDFPKGGPVRMRLEEVPEAGFANAWNLLSHTFSRPDADFIFLVNADIAIDQPEAFEWMLTAIQRDADLQVVAPVGRKNIADGKRETLGDRIRLASSCWTECHLIAQGGGLCFCAKASSMRKIWIPKGFPGAVEGCFKRMILSEMGTTPNKPWRAGMARNAGYTFKNGYSLRDIYLRRVRWFVGQTFIDTLMRHLRSLHAEQPSLNLANRLRAHDETDPAWIYRLVQLHIHRNGLFRTMPSLFFRFRFLREARVGGVKKAVLFPVALIASLLDFPFFLSAAWHLKAGRVLDVWRDSLNHEIRRTTFRPE